MLAVAEEGDPWPYALFDEERDKPYLTGTVDTRPDPPTLPRSETP